MTISEQGTTGPVYDAVIVGAGLSGLYQLHRLREMGLSARVIEAGDGVGGTWYWNRYPGARCDSPSHVYQYWFSQELLDEWEWSERFPSQPEVLKYLEFVAEKFALNEDIEFNTRVTAAIYDESRHQWQVATDDGTSLNARFFITAIGGLSMPLLPPVEGLEHYAGDWHHTSRWPHTGVDFTGKRVGVVGTGATGIQIIQEAAKTAQELKVFQRTPNYAIPIRNPQYDSADWAEIRKTLPRIKQQIKNSFSGFEFDLDPRSALEFDAGQRRKILEELWADGSLKFWVGNFADILADEDANATVSEFVREKIRARVKDPVLADKLCPTNHGFGTRRVPLENGYFEVYNQDNVELIDLRETPMQRYSANGIVTPEHEYPLDMIVFATGFDAVTGAMGRINIQGRDGADLREKWSQSPSTYLGLQSHGFPNLFMVTGPTAPSVAFCNYPTCAAEQVEWIADCIGYVTRQGMDSIEPREQAEQDWMTHASEAAAMSLIPKTDSWWLGTNIPGKNRVLLSYVGGAPAYRELCDEEQNANYKGFALS